MRSELFLVAALLLLHLLFIYSEPVNKEVQSITGLGKFALELSRGASLRLPYELSAHLANSFTFECWIWLDNPKEGTFKPIVYRGPGTSNHHNEFLLQVNVAGKLVFFMGNGNSVSTYGVLAVSTGTLAPRKWHHVGFAIHTEEWRVNPSKISVYFGDGKEDYEWAAGTRQYRPDKPIYIATYSNPETHWFNGKIDEIRFWSEYRSLSQISALKNLPAPLENAKLKAYYDCNTKDFKFIRDRTKSRFDATILRSSLTGEGVTFNVSGVKIHKMIAFAFDLDVKRSFMLDKLEDNNTVYFLESFPAEGRVLDSFGNAFDPKDLPIQLKSNFLRFDTTDKPSITSFRVYGARRYSSSPDYFYRAEEESTIIYVKTDVKRRDGQLQSFGKPEFCQRSDICTDACRKGL